MSSQALPALNQRFSTGVARISEARSPRLLSQVPTSFPQVVKLKNDNSQHNNSHLL